MVVTPLQPTHGAPTLQRSCFGNAKLSLLVFALLPLQQLLLCWRLRLLCLLPTVAAAPAGVTAHALAALCSWCPLLLFGAAAVLH